MGPNGEERGGLAESPLRAAAPSSSSSATSSQITGSPAAAGVSTRRTRDGGAGSHAAATPGASNSAGSGTGSSAEVLQALSRVGLVAVLDLCVVLYKFVNVELHSQGWYAVRVRVVPGPDAVCAAHTVIQSQQMSNSAGAATTLLQPVVCGYPGGGMNGGGGGLGFLGSGFCSSGGRSSGGDSGGAASGSTAARRQGWLVDESGSCFRSCVFRIRYCFEEVRLQTALLSRIYVTSLQALPALSVTMEFELLFQEANLENPSLVPDEFQLRPVARESVTLNRVSGGVAEYFGCTFSDEHFGLCSTGLFGGMVGYATRDIVNSSSQPEVSSNWLCHLVGDSARRDAGLTYRSDSCSGIGGGWPSSNGSTSTQPNHGHSESAGNAAAVTAAAAARGGAAAATASGRVTLGPEFLEFNDQELRKKIIRLLHHVVEAPSIKQGIPHIPSEEERLERLAAAFEILVESHRRSRDRLASFLRQAPSECFAPQNLDVLRALLASAAAAAAAEAAGPATTGATALDVAARVAAQQSLLRGAGPRAAAAAPLTRLGSTADTSALAAGYNAVSSTPTVPTVPAFLSLIRGCPTTAAALQQLDGVLLGLSADSRTDWAVLNWVVRTLPRELMRHLKLCWEAAQPDAVLPFIVWESSPSRDVIAAKAAAHRQKLRTPRFRLPAVQPSSLWGTPGEQPVLVVDDSQGIKWLAESDNYFGNGFRPRDETHVAIFVHGFQGASTDLCLVKAHLMLMYPYLECFSSKTNEGNTHDSLQEMGKRLAAEMAEFLAPLSRSTRRPLRKITLVGHSIGNLILRAALTQPEFEEFKQLLWLYISVCGPHLGFLYGSNAVVDTGLMLLKTIGKGKCLHQLTFSDAPQLTDCYLYRLAHECPLSVFKLVVAVSSPQDRYVPYHSSAITSCPQAERDSRRGRCYAEMLRALTAGLGTGSHLFRLAVDFSLKTKSFSFSKLVGRTAHIEFIESQLYVGLMTWGLVHRYTMLAPSPHSWL